ncbi:MAG: ABC transporter ATP-binding protein [Pseudomonadota bacterium]
MAMIRVENITLVHPVFAASAGRMDAHADRSRMAVNKRGRVVGVKALQGISFELGTGRRVGLIGANGSGKTTLLRVLAGILPPDEGCVIVEGRTTNLININLGVKPEASGHRNITLQALANGYSREDIEARRERIAKFSELGSFLDLSVDTYSSGMRMRLSFAIATAFQPEILLLDEWLSAGDANFREKAAKRMREFADEAGILIVASHNPALLRNTCESVLWLEEGRVRMLGPVDEVLDAYLENNGKLGEGDGGAAEG